MLSKLLFLLTLIHVSFGICSQGCLSCSTSTTCLLCNVSNNFYLSNNDCFPYLSLKCATISQTGVCLYCVCSNYLDLTVNRCIALTTNTPNCLYYNTSQNCIICNSGYFLTPNYECVPDCKLLGSDYASCWKFPKLAF